MGRGGGGGSSNPASSLGSCRSMVEPGASVPGFQKRRREEEEEEEEAAVEEEESAIARFATAMRVEVHTPAVLVRRGGGGAGGRCVRRLLHRPLSLPLLLLLDWPALSRPLKQSSERGERSSVQRCAAPLPPPSRPRTRTCVVQSTPAATTTTGRCCSVLSSPPLSLPLLHCGFCCARARIRIHIQVASQRSARVHCEPNVSNHRQQRRRDGR